MLFGKVGTNLLLLKFPASGNTDVFPPIGYNLSRASRWLNGFLRLAKVARLPTYGTDSMVSRLGKRLQGFFYARPFTWFPARGTGYMVSCRLNCVPHIARIACFGAFWHWSIVLHTWHCLHGFPHAATFKWFPALGKVFMFRLVRYLVCIYKAFSVSHY